jgi:multisubunit Na+/H+ antiporter MnhG subunit
MEFLDLPWFDDDVFKMMIRFGINLFFLILLVHFAIYPSQRQREFAFTAIMMNVIVFFICFALKKLELNLGMALGLFAVFGVLRYRTDAMGITEMTYLFVVIGVAMINSLANKTFSYTEILVVNLIVFITAILRKLIMDGSRAVSSPEAEAGRSDSRPEKSKVEKLVKITVDYDDLRWLSAADRPQLIKDLRDRTGIEAVRVQVDHLDIAKKRATLVVWANESTFPQPAASN